MAGNASAVSGGTISRSSAATAAELNHVAAALGPVFDAAAENRANVHPGRGDHARGDRCAGAAAADRDDRAVPGKILEALADDPVRHVPCALDVALVALGLLAHIEDLYLAVGQHAVEVLDLERLELLARVPMREIAAQLEQADGAQSARRFLGV